MMRGLLTLVGLVLFLYVAASDFGWFGASSEHVVGLFSLGVSCELVALLHRTNR